MASKRFWRKLASRLCTFPGDQKFCQNRSISLCFKDKHVLCRNSRWPPKVVGKRFLWEDANRICRYPEGQKLCRKISGLLYFQDKHILRKNSRWPPKVVGKGFFFYIYFFLISAIYNEWKRFPEARVFHFRYL